MRASNLNTNDMGRESTQANPEDTAFNTLDMRMPPRAYEYRHKHICVSVCVLASVGTRVVLNIYIYVYICAYMYFATQNHKPVYLVLVKHKHMSL